MDEEYGYDTGVHDFDWGKKGQGEQVMTIA